MNSRTRHLAHLALLALIGATACGDDGGPSAATGGGGDTGAGGSDATGAAGGGGPAGGSDPICDRYVACVAATQPAALEQVRAQYGDEGACWESPDLAAACVSGCREGLAASRATHPDEPLCSACTGDDECVAPGLGRCVEGACVACRDAADCTGSTGTACEAGACAADPDVACFIELVQTVVAIDIDPVCATEACPDETAAAFGPGGACDGVCASSSPCFEGDQPSAAAQAYFECATAADCAG